MGATEPLAEQRRALAELAAEAKAIGLVLPVQALRQFEVYLGTLLIWRARVSLTAAASPADIVRFHILDALRVARYIEPGYRVADLGSGAGFPGIPLAIVCPGAKLVLVESRRKRANFLREVVRGARLENVEVMEDRAEALATQRGGQFDVVVSRAVWQLAEFLDIGATLLRPGGLAIAMKGPKALAEAVAHPSFGATEMVRYQLNGAVERVLLLARRR